MKQINLLLGAGLAVLAGGCDTALERNLEGKQVVLMAPVNNLVTTDTFQTFYWENLDGALSYRLRVVSPRFDSIVRFILDTTITRTTYLKDLDPGIYQWRVEARNNNSTSEPGETRNFKIQ